MYIILREKGPGQFEGKCPVEAGRLVKRFYLLYFIIIQLAFQHFLHSNPLSCDSDSPSTSSGERSCVDWS